MTSELPVGARIRYWRRHNGNRSQAAIAGLCGITEDYLGQIERGRKAPSLDVLVALAREIGVPVSALLDHQAPTEEPAPQHTAPDVARVLMGYRAASHAPASPAPATLRERVEAAWRTWQTSQNRFTESARILPDLLTDVEHAVRSHRAGTDPVARRETLRTAADLYGLLRSYCRRTGRIDLSLLVADRALRAAEDADDPLRIAGAQWNLGHVLLAQDEPEGAEQVATLAAEQIKEPETPDEHAMAGALELVAVTAQARRRNWWAARRRLERRALPKAKAAGEGNVGWTVFGPTNVDLHALSIEMLAGEATEGLRCADRVDISCLPSLERQFTFLLDIARCYDLRKEDAAVLVHLLDLEQLAPEDVARSPLARQMLTDLRRRVRPTYRRQVEDLVDRIGLDEAPGLPDNPA